MNWQDQSQLILEDQNQLRNQNRLNRKPQIKIILKSLFVWKVWEELNSIIDLFLNPILFDKKFVEKKQLSRFKWIWLKLWWSDSTSQLSKLLRIQMKVLELRKEMMQICSRNKGLRKSMITKQKNVKSFNIRCTVNFLNEKGKEMKLDSR